MRKMVQMSLVAIALAMMVGCSGKGDINVINSQSEKKQEAPKAANTQKPKIRAVEKKPETNTEEKNQKPSSGLYPEMVVDKLQYKPLDKNDKVVYITFDDGPCESTPKLLKVLKDLDVKATFFVTAQFGCDENLVKWMKQIHEDGHGLGVHSYAHDYKAIYGSVKNFLADYKKMDDLIIKATGERGHVYRFPGGSNTGYNKKIRKEVIKDLNSRGIVYYDWNAYDGDCDGYSKSQLVAKAVEESSYKNKSILLMHNIPGKEDVIDAMPQIVKQLKKEGYRFGVLDGAVEPIQFEK